MAVIHSPRFHGFGTCADRRLHIGDRGCGLKPRIMAGAQTEQNEVIVVIDKPRNGRAAAEIDHLHAGTAIRVAVVANLHELAVLDRRGRYDRIASVEGVDLSVDQLNIAGMRAMISIIVSVVRKSGNDHRRPSQ